MTNGVQRSDALERWSNGAARPADVGDGDDAGALASASIPALVRWVRRRADLSQRDLAAQLGVSQSLVAHWENGVSEPSLRVFLALVALARLQLALVENDGGAVDVAQQARDDAEAVRDRAGRRFPAHLDVVPVEGESSAGDVDEVRCARRAWRDWLRHKGGEVPARHPSWGEVRAVLRQRRTTRRSALAAAQRERLRLLPPPPPPAPCICLDGCFEVPGCLPECSCRCEPIVDRRWVTRWESLSAPDGGLRVRAG